MASIKPKTLCTQRSFTYFIFRNAEQQRILWKIPDISQKSENGGVGSLLARFQLSEGPSKPSPLVVQFTSEGSTLSGCDIELVGAGYRFSLIKKRFAAGKYLADN